MADLKEPRAKRRRASPATTPGDRALPDKGTMEAHLATVTSDKARATAARAQTIMYDA